MSSGFLSKTRSNYYSSVEMQRALKRHETGEAFVIPIILRPVDWKNDTSLNKLMVLPTDAKPVTAWSDPPGYDTAFVDIVEGIRKAVEEYR